MEIVKSNKYIWIIVAILAAVFLEAKFKLFSNSLAKAKAMAQPKKAV